MGRAKNLENLISVSQAKKLIKEYGDNERNIKVFRWAKGKHFLIRCNGNVVLHPPIKKEEFVLGNILDRTINELWERVPVQYKMLNEKLTTNLQK